MALNFQQPNFDPNEGKKKSRQYLRETIQGIPSLMFQYEALKRQREADKNDYELGKFNAETNRMNASKTSSEKKERFWTLDKDNNAIDLLTKQPIKSWETGIDYQFVSNPNDKPMSESQQENLNARNRGQVFEVAGRMRSDPEIKPLYQQKINAGTVGKIIDFASGGNTVASAALGVKMARSMGEVGTMTDGDIVRYVQSGRLDRKVGDKLSLWLKGKPTDATLEEIQQISAVLSEVYNERVQPVYNWYTELLANNLGITNEEAAKRLAVTYKPVDDDSTSTPQTPQPGPAATAVSPGATIKNDDPLGIR